MVSSQNYGCLPSPRANWSVHGSRDISGGTSNGPFRFSRTGIFGTSFEGGPLCPVWSVRPKCPFPFDKIVVPSTALLYPAYKNNNQTRGGLGQVCATGIPFHWAREISEISDRNFGLMFRPGIAFTICTNQSYLPKNGQETPKLVLTTLKKWNTNCRLEHSVRKNRATFSDIPLLPKIFLPE